MLICVSKTQDAGQWNLTTFFYMSAVVLESSVTPGSKASRVNLCPGDIILAIQGASTEGMTHAEAQNKIKDSTNQLFLKIERSETKMWSPQVIEEGKVNPFKINLEAEKQVSVTEEKNKCTALYFLSAYNMQQENLYYYYFKFFFRNISLYSQDNIQDALQGQIQGLVHEKPEGPKPLTSIEESHVYRMLQENQEQPHEPRQSGSFKALQDFVESDGELPFSVIWGNSTS
uniref:PDZ and LIM domain 3b n=1 Tax=Sinocyclocheilus grahami TaxID=75366 RepID=A0A672KBS2_SINGR